MICMKYTNSSLLQIVLHLKEEVVKLECEMSEVHQFLSHSVNRDSMPWEQLISRALDLFAKYPPAGLQKRAKLIQEIRQAFTTLSFMQWLSLNFEQSGAKWLIVLGLIFCFY